MAKVKAIEKMNRERLLKVNPDLTDETGYAFYMNGTDILLPEYSEVVAMW